MKTPKWFLGGAVALAVGLSGCAMSDPGAASEQTGGAGSNPGGYDVSAVEPVEELSAAVPDEMRERGTMTVGATTSTVPMQYVDEDGNTVGAAIDLFRALGAVLDLEVEVEEVTFDALQPGIESGRFDTVNLADLPDRRERLDYIDTYKNGASVLAHTDYEPDELDIDTELCGHTVAAVKGSGAEKELTVRSDDCVENGEEAIEISSYGDAAAVVLAVSSKQNEFALFETVASLAAAERDPERLKVVYSNYMFMTGVAVPNDDPELLEAFHNGLKHLVDSGVYDEIFDHYGVLEATIPELPINEGGAPPQ